MTIIITYTLSTNAKDRLLCNQNTVNQSVSLKNFSTGPALPRAHPVEIQQWYLVVRLYMFLLHVHVGVWKWK